MMGSIGGALAAASNLLGIRTPRADATVPSVVHGAAALADAEDDAVPARLGRGVLAPGEPCFEAVAEALAEAGYLNS